MTDGFALSVDRPHLHVHQIGRPGARHLAGQDTNSISELYTLLARARQSRHTGVGSTDSIDQIGMRTKHGRLASQHGKVHGAFSTVQVYMTGRQLADLAKTTSKAQARYRRLAKMFQNGPHEVPHFDKCHVGKSVQPTHGGLAGGAGTGGDVLDAVGPRNVDPLVDGRDVGRAGIRPDDTRRPENGQATHDSKAWVHRFERQCGTVLDTDGDLEPTLIGHRACKPAEMVLDHPTRNRVDRRFADGELEPFAGDGSNTLTRVEPNP